MDFNRVILNKSRKSQILSTKRLEREGKTLGGPRANS